MIGIDEEQLRQKLSVVRNPKAINRLIAALKYKFGLIGSNKLFLTENDVTQYLRSALQNLKVPELYEFVC